MNWLYMLVLGLLAGIIGKILLPGKDPGGLIITILLGIGGAYLGGWIGGQLGWGGITGDFDIRSIGLSVGGVIVLLLVYRLVRKKS
ncbi:MAG: GlsB/YeaQ/YmgE family stress response membrane protein [Verrucomicrobiales bacterium]|nr:GlsB/YeaQ/YmgE family stress response membrane protein [Verrucomicrobiales bacterium]